MASGGGPLPKGTEGGSRSASRRRWSNSTCLPSPGGLLLYQLTHKNGPDFPSGHKPLKPYIPPEPSDYERILRQLLDLCNRTPLNGKCSQEQCRKEAQAIANAYVNMFDNLKDEYHWHLPWSNYHAGRFCYQWQTLTYLTLKPLLDQSKCFKMHRVGNVSPGKEKCLEHNWIALTCSSSPVPLRQVVAGGSSTVWLDPWWEGKPCVYTCDLRTGKYKRPLRCNFVVFPGPNGFPDDCETNHPTGCCGAYYPTPGGSGSLVEFEGWEWDYDLRLAMTCCGLTNENTIPSKPK
jgi:hypothetical protein